MKSLYYDRETITDILFRTQRRTADLTEVNLQFCHEQNFSQKPSYESLWLWFQKTLVVKKKLKKHEFCAFLVNHSDNYSYSVWQQVEDKNKLSWYKSDLFWKIIFECFLGNVVGKCHSKFMFFPPIDIIIENHCGISFDCRKGLNVISVGF